MRRWSLALEVENRVAHDQAVAELPERIHPYVFVSREAGAGGSEVGRRVGMELGWQVVDREMLDQIAEQHKLPVDMLRHVDETTSNWILEVFGKWIDRRLVTQSEYVVHLGHMVLLAARHANTVFVGRGAQFLLPRDKGVVVRIIAPVGQRVARIMEQRHLTREQAEKHVKEADQGRRDFVQRYFHHNVADPHLYDLVINLQYLTLDEAVEVIVGHARRRLNVQPQSA
jgi:cytidylate kinase